MIADWLMSLASQAHVSIATDNGLTGLVQAVAAVIWATANSDLAGIVQEEFKVPLFRYVFTGLSLVCICNRIPKSL